MDKRYGCRNRKNAKWQTKKNNILCGKWMFPDIYTFQYFYWKVLEGIMPG